jgi:hypothetical protein
MKSEASFATINVKDNYDTHIRLGCTNVLFGVGRSLTSVRLHGGGSTSASRVRNSFWNTNRPTHKDAEAMIFCNWDEFAREKTIRELLDARKCRCVIWGNSKEVWSIRSWIPAGYEVRHTVNVVFSVV